MVLHNSATRPPRAFTWVGDAQLDTSGERFTVHRELGRGGMATVSEVSEVATGRRVAIKRLHTQLEPVAQQRNAELFAREFHTLSQLEHPRIVTVYDYGKDAVGTYYTMELLSGGDLKDLTPLPWRTAVAIARDVCSALSLLHSRRLVHRDVSPRNVRRTQVGPAKLIDFGAVAAMGSSKMIVGTPPCCAPESLHLQPLDARTDLFALGATLYYALLGRHAYPAWQFSALQDVWHAGVVPPSRVNPEIPAALDALLLELLRLEPDTRPSNAAEVIQRLCAIDGEPSSEQLQVAQAYLSMPTLVGREDALTRVRRKLSRVAPERCRPVVIEGASGVGRSRFLDACLLDATLLGAICARADADDGVSGDYGVLRALARQLSSIMPAGAREAAGMHLDVLGRVLPELLTPHADGNARVRVFDDPALRPQLQAATAAWLRTLSERGPVILAVDDFHRIDEPSAALLALLSDSVNLLLSCESGEPWISVPAQRVVLDSAVRVALEQLSPDDSANLLKSLFGDVPNVELLAHRLDQLSSGNPRDLLRLAQHMIDRDVVRYDAGAWSLPQHIDDADVPSSMAQALRARLEALSPSARELGCAFALCADQSFRVDECAYLVESSSESTLRRDLVALVNVDAVRHIDDEFGLSKPPWAAALRSMATPALESALHVRLAEVLLLRQQDFRAGQHLLRAGRHDRGLDVLVAHAAASQEETARDPEGFVRYVRSLPADWFATYQTALALCEERARPERERYILLGRLLGLMPAFGMPSSVEVATFIERLRWDSGLADWQTLASVSDPKQRIVVAMECAQSRYDSSEDHARVYDVPTALRLLARALAVANGNVTQSLDIAEHRKLPPIAAFAPISPVIAGLSRLMRGIDARYAGRPESARQIYLEVLSGDSAISGEDTNYSEVTRHRITNGLGTIEACMGLSSCLEYAARTQTHPAYRIGSEQTRMLYHLFQGDVRRAEACRKEIEKLRVHTFQFYESPLMIWELGAHIMAEDLTRIRQTMEQIAPLVPHYPAWRAIHLYASAEYHRARRDAEHALRDIEQALTLSAAGEHPLWASIATTHVHALDESGLSHEALATAERYVRSAEDAKLGYLAESLWLALALCRARAKQPHAAVLCEAVLDRLGVLGVQGLHLGVAHETRARVALLLEDHAAFEFHSRICKVIYGAHKNSGLLAKLKRLQHDFERVRGVVVVPQASADSCSPNTDLRLVTALRHCKGDEQRARLALTMLLQHAGAKAGMLFTVDVDELVCAATVGEVPPVSELQTRVTEYLAAQLVGPMTTSTGGQGLSEPPLPDWSDDAGRSFLPVLLRHSTDGVEGVTGVALLQISSNGLRYPAELAAAISRFFADGEHTSLLLTD